MRACTPQPPNSQTTFEAGWQEYVKLHYGVDGGAGVEFFDALARFETEVTVSYGIYRRE